MGGIVIWSCIWGFYGFNDGFNLATMMTGSCNVRDIRWKMRETRTGRSPVLSGLLKCVWSSFGLATIYANDLRLLSKHRQVDRSTTGNTACLFYWEVTKI